MLPQSIIDKICAKYGKEHLYSSDCAALAGMIGIGETTVKRMLGLVGDASPERNRVPHVSTMDILSKWLGYENYDKLLREIGKKDYSSEFTPIKSIDATALVPGTRVMLRYEPARSIVMTYVGNGEFTIDESKNSKLQKGDRIRLAYLVLGQEMIASEVMRNGKSLGSYRAAKDGGLTQLEIID